MSNQDTEIQQGERKICKTAVSSVICVILFVLSFLLFCEAEKFRRDILSKFFAFLQLALLFTTPILAILALVKLKCSKGHLAGKGIAIVGLTASSILLLLAFLMPLHGRAPKGYVHGRMCMSKLEHLGKALNSYANANDIYPTSTNWCDLLVSHADVAKKVFLCQGAVSRGDKGPSHYAINPNCEPNSPPDIVLLFETKGGWNQSGGPELLIFENHKSGEEGNILFKDGHVLFNDGYVDHVESEDVNGFKWIPE